jgi:HSP20 family protein
MADRQTSLTSTRDERRQAQRTPFSELGTNPFRGLQRFADEMDRLFDDFTGGRRRLTTPSWAATAADTWAPSIDVFQKNNELTIRADLPGMKKDDVTVEITDDAVIVQGERRREREEEREGIYTSECSYGSFSRVVPLPEGAITEEAKATFRDGVLEITLPAPPASKGRRLEIAEESKK